MILEMSDSEKKKLLKNIKNWLQPEPTEMRQQPREPSFIPVECSSSDHVCFTDIIQDISTGGIFIQTGSHFFVGQQIPLTFLLPKTGNDISMGGKVVRVDSQGIGVKFNEPLVT